jgi:flagellar protein FliO/FliZ
MRRFLALPLGWASSAFAAEATAPSAAGAMLQSFLALVLVLGVIAGAAWLLRRTQQLQGTLHPNVLKSISAIAVGPKERVVVVEVGETWLVVGVAPGQVRTLHTLPKQELPPSQQLAPRFADWLARARKGKT